MRRELLPRPLYRRVNGGAGVCDPLQVPHSQEVAGPGLQRGPAASTARVPAAPAMAPSPWIPALRLEMRGLDGEFCRKETDPRGWRKIGWSDLLRLGTPLGPAIPAGRQARTFTCECAPRVLPPHRCLPEMDAGASPFLPLRPPLHATLAHSSISRSRV